MLDPISLAVAVAGLALTGYQQVRHWRGDRVALRLRAEVSEFDKAWLLIVNTGRRIIIIKGAYAEMSDGGEQQLIYVEALPKTLEEQQDH